MEWDMMYLLKNILGACRTSMRRHRNHPSPARPNDDMTYIKFRVPEKMRAWGTRNLMQVKFG